MIHGFLFVASQWSRPAGSVACSLLALAFLQVSERFDSTLEGRWRNPSGSVTISIAPCDGSLCGRVVAASEKAKADARRGGTDPLIGAELLSDFVPHGESRWTVRLFVPDINRTSKAELRLVGTYQLKVTGCAVGGIVCKSQVWVREQAD